MNSNSRISKLVLATAALLILPTLSQTAHAYYSTIDTGNLIAPGKYQVSAETQGILNRYDGVNEIGRFDTGIDDYSSMRAILGFGAVGFDLGGFYKYVPFPDTAKQPAIGGEVGAEYTRVNGNTEFNIRFNPLVSKKFETEIGDVTPYASIPIGIDFRYNETVVPIQFVAGAEFTFLNTPNLSYFAEFGIDVNEAFGYLSAAVAWRFDDSLLHSH